MDVNLAKQLNILISDMETSGQIVMDQAQVVGYGIEYGYSVMEQQDGSLWRLDDSTAMMVTLLKPGSKRKVGDEFLKHGVIGQRQFWEVLLPSRYLNRALLLLRCSPVSIQRLMAIEELWLLQPASNSGVTSAVGIQFTSCYQTNKVV
jgi:hypothetical protein